MISAQEATSDLTSIMKGFHLSVNEVATAVDKLTAVDMQSASSAGGIAQALEQVANVANTAGVSLDQTIGMISTISDVTQREPSSVGQALRTMIARFSNVKAGVYGTMNVDSDNAEATENVNDIEKVLKKVGIQVRSSELDFRSFSDVLSDVADKWDTLDDVSKKAIATSVAGVRQSEQFYALMNNWDKYQKLTEVSANSAGTAEKKYLSYMEQLEAAQKRLQAAWESLAHSTQSRNPNMDQSQSESGYFLGHTPLGTSTYWKEETDENGKTIDFVSANGDKLNRDPRWAESEDATYDEANLVYDKNTQQYYSRDDDGVFTNLDGVVASDDALKGRLDKQYWADDKKYDLGRKSSGKSASWGTKSARAATGAQIGMAVVSGALSAPTSGQWINHITGEAETRQFSAGTEAVSRAVGGAASGLGALIGSFGGPIGTAIGSSLGGVLGDVLDKYVVPLMDKQNNNLKDIAESGEKTLSVMNVLKGDLSTLSSLNDKTWASADYTSASSTVRKIRTELASNKAARSSFEAAMGGEDYNTLLDEYMNPATSESRRKEITNRLTLAESSSSNQAYVASQTTKLAELDKQRATLDLGTNNSYSNWAFAGGPLGMLANQIVSWQEWATGDRHSGSNDPMVEALKAADTSGKLKIKSERNGWEKFAAILGINVSQDVADTSNMTTDEALTMFKNMETNAATNTSISSDVLDRISDTIATLEEIKAKEDEINDTINEGNVNSAILGSGVEDLTSAQLKQMGPDAVKQKVAEYLSTHGGLNGHDIWANKEQGILTSYADTKITASLKSNENLYGIVSGQSYTLQEALGLPTGLESQARTKNKILNEFAAAIGTTREQLDQFTAEYGNLTLGDFLSTPADLRTKLSDYSKYLGEIASSVGLTQESLENIIDKYPEFIKDLGDSEKLAEDFITLSSQTSDLYSSSVMNSIMGQGDFYTSFTKELQKNTTLWDSLSKNSAFTKITNFDELKKWLAANEGSPDAEAVLTKAREYLDFNVAVAEKQEAMDAAINYQTKMMDKQISNLTEQKDALGKINNQREYGNKLIEAQLKLENAQKEKKLVYRSGVGFTYESDQTAIKEAQDNLDSLDIEKQQDLLQTEIDQLTSEKQLLSDLANDEELKNLKDEYEAWAKSNSVINDSQAKILSTIQNFYAKYDQLNASNAFVQGVSADKATLSNASDTMNAKYDAYMKIANDKSASNKDKAAALADFQDAATAYVSAGGTLSSEQKEAYGVDADKQYYTGKNYFFTEGGNRKFGAEGTSLSNTDPYANYIITDKNKNALFLFSSKYPSGRNVSAYANDGGYDNLKSLASALYTDSDYNTGGIPIILEGAYKDHEYASYNGNQLYKVNVSDNGWTEENGWNQTDRPFAVAAALGSYGLPGGPTLVNEQGTEAIVTPYGTLTSLPSDTGVVPADLTKKLYDLSMVSPSILNALGAYKTGGGVSIGGLGSTSNDESLNINSLTMNVTAGSDFDADAFADALKQQAALTKRNH
jgi:hypothetical protein